MSERKAFHIQKRLQTCQYVLIRAIHCNELFSLNYPRFIVVIAQKDLILLCFLAKFPFCQPLSLSFFGYTIDRMTQKEEKTADE